MFFNSQGPQFRWRETGLDLLLEYYQLDISPRELGNWIIQASAHGAPLASLRLLSPNLFKDSRKPIERPLIIRRNCQTLPIAWTCK